jgi:hypothetical protein
MTRYALVDVATDRQIGCVAAKQLLVAAVPLSDALDAVLAKVPPGWAASLSSNLLTLEQVDALKLRAGDVRGIGLGRKPISRFGVAGSGIR